MPSRKQRRRREKSIRHESEWIDIDEDGNEIPVDSDVVRAEREASRTETKPAAKKGGKPAKKQVRTREPQPASWNRAFKRGGLFGIASFVLFVFVLKGGSEIIRAIYGLVYMVAFVPLTYFVDRWTYRTFERRRAKDAANRGK